VRELRNVIERAVILARHSPIINARHLNIAGDTPTSAVTLSFEHEPTFEELERSYLLRMLEKYAGNRARTAHALGISERNVYRLIKTWGLAED